MTLITDIQDQEDLNRAINLERLLAHRAVLIRLNHALVGSWPSNGNFLYKRMREFVDEEMHRNDTPSGLLARGAK